MHAGEVGNAPVTHLIGDDHIIERLLDFGHVLLLVGVQVVEALVEFYPKSIAAQLTRVGFQIERLGGIGEIALVDGQRTAYVLPVVVKEVPEALDRLQVLLASRGTVHVHVRLNGRDQIVVRTVVGVLPYRVRIALREPFHPVILLEIALHGADVLGAAHRREIGAREGDGTLYALSRTAEHLGQEGRGLEPVIESAQHAESLGVTCISGLYQAMGNPRAHVGAVLEVKDGTLGVGHQIAVWLLALVNHIHHAVHACTQGFVLHPAQRAAGTHQKASGCGARQLVSPEIAVAPADRRNG